MSEAWEFEDNENLIAESDILCWSHDDAEAEQAAWLRGPPDEVLADLAGAPGAWPPFRVGRAWARVRPLIRH
jgi:hypothetical protein